MKIILESDNNYVLRFDKNDLVLQGIADFMTAQNIQACAFTGLGTVASAELGFFNAHIKDYRKKPFIEEMEIVSLTGNGAILSIDSKPIVHAHGSFSRNDFTSVAGHIFELVTLATCEIFLTNLTGKMERQNNVDFNLNLLQ